MLSLQPDEHMKWIYDTSHPDYNTGRAEDLRNRRASAFQSCPRYMLEEARINDILRTINISEHKYKYEIGEKLYPSGCSSEYKKNNPFIVGKRRIEQINYTVDGDTIIVNQEQYSPDSSEYCQTWYLKSSLTRCDGDGTY